MSVLNPYKLIIMKFLLFTLSIFCAAQVSFAQGIQFENKNAELAFYSDVMINAFDAKNRIIASKQFADLFEKEISSEGSFEKTFDESKSISIQYSEDRSLRFISWQVKESDTKYSYKTYLQTSDGTLQEFTNDSYISEDDLENTYSRNWPSQLIYKIKDTKTADGKAYIVFSMKQVDTYNKVKVADVLTLKDGSASFGSPIFVMNADSERPRKYNRIVMMFGADANASLNYNPGLEMIVYDNVIPQSGMMPGQGVSKYPDGSYQAYSFKEGKWNHIDKLYNEVMSEAPRPNPVNKKPGGGVFGKKIGGTKKKN